MVQISFGRSERRSGTPRTYFARAPPPALRNLQIPKPIEAPKSLIVHVRVALARLALVAIVQPLAAAAGIRLGEFRNSLDQRCVFCGLDVRLFVGTNGVVRA